jgi:hypothetical protein
MRAHAYAYKQLLLAQVRLKPFITVMALAHQKLVLVQTGLTSPKP